STTAMNRNIREKKMEGYLKNPKLCLVCEEPIPFKKRRDNQYCSHSCSATASGRRRRKPKICKFCEQEFFSHHKNRKCCSRKCTNLWRWENITKPAILKGERSNRTILRKFLIERDSDECSVCDIEDWNNKPITLQVDHIDGNPANNHPTNLRLICPNCHSQTEFFGGRNKGNGRKSRGIPR
ncbi:hypothetical protein LCGC14_2660950, partial [marine sediment metagenome]